MYEIVVTVRAKIENVEDVDMILEDIHGLFDDECQTQLIGIFENQE